MCGILAIYREGGLRPDDYFRGLKALESIAHRGPDGEGLELIHTPSGAVTKVRLPGTPAAIHCDVESIHPPSQGQDLFLAHRRLSIFDLSPAGHQPMQGTDGSSLIFNGEVYNFPELREELEKKGSRFKTGTDTEVILEAFRIWGPDCVQRFNGMWAMVLFDQTDHRIWITIDRIGIKQLYFYAKDGYWVVASEIKAIRAAVGEHLAPNQLRVNHFLEHGNADLGEETLFKGIRRFQPSTFLCAAPNEIAQSPAITYWDFPVGQKQYANVERAADRLRSLLDDAIRLRMRSDVPWGTTLSGGLDSSSIVTAAKRIRDLNGEEGPIHTFTAIFPGEEGDESGFVKLLGATLDLDTQFINPRETFDLADFERFLHHQDLPVANTSMYAQWSVMKLVGRSNVKVLLDGQGGDELFAGYHHHVYKYGRYLLLRGKMGAYRALVRDFAAMKGMKEADVSNLIKDDLKLYFKLKMGFKMPGPPEATAWNGAKSLRDILALDIRQWVMPMLLRYEDRNSMAFSLEARLPFLDYRLVEFAMQLPDKFKIHEGWQKHVLRVAMPDLPDSIRWRKDKKGFTTPHKSWVEGHRGYFESLAAKIQGMDVPAGFKDPSQMNVHQLFRAASLGFWLNNDI